MEELSIETWEVLHDSFSLRSKMASTIFAIKGKAEQEKWFINEAEVLREQGFNEQAILEYQYHLPILLENPCMAAHITRMDDLETDCFIPNLKNIFDVLNWVNLCMRFDAKRTDLCFLLRLKLIEELKDVVSSETLAAITDEHLPSSMLNHYF